MNCSYVDIEVSLFREAFATIRNRTKVGPPRVERHSGVVNVDMFLELASGGADYRTVLTRRRMYKFRMGLQVEITSKADKAIAWRLIVITSIKLLRAQRTPIASFAMKTSFMCTKLHSRIKTLLALKTSVWVGM